MNKLIIVLGIITVTALGILLFSSSDKLDKLGGVISQSLVTSGMTHNSVTVNTTSTQVLGSNWGLYSRITTGGTAISCYADGQTAASSSVAINKGVVITANTWACFGYAFGCLPYVGTVNCLAAATTSVGIFYK
ncbi:MAG: hypothetical protein QMD65_02020 [Patescibacteria group bacterium]|nr:hypothetical protein [Patescibacteria group bacterium]